MTYLTQVTLDLASAARHGLRDNYDWHQAVWKAFPGRDGEPRDFLTRLDQRREGFRLLIVSPARPVRPEWCPADEDSWKTKPISETYFTRARYTWIRREVSGFRREWPKNGELRQGILQQSINFHRRRFDPPAVLTCELDAVSSLSTLG